MNENMKNEIEKYAEIISVSVEEASATFDAIVDNNNLDVNTDEGLRIARSVFRSKFGQARARMKQTEESGDKGTEYTGPTFTQKATGLFWAKEDARNWEENRRNTLMADYQRDANNCLNSGDIALAVQLSDGRYEVSRSIDGELPDVSPMQVDDDRWIIPVDNRKAWASGQANPNYGKPLPAEAWSRRLFFVGKVGDSTEYQEYQLRINGEQAKDFDVNTFNWCEFTCVPNSNNPSILSARKDGSTLDSLTYVEGGEDVLEIIQSTLGEKVSALVALDSYHSDNSHKPSHERMVITDGNVANMKLEPTSNGNRILHLSDLNADFDYDGDGYSSVTCWIPKSLDIDFGIGSNVIISGRTSQGTDADGVLRNVSVNVLGLYVVDRHGSAGEVYVEPVEDNGDWW